MVCRLGDPRKGLTRAIHGYEMLLRLHPSAPDLVLAGRGTLAAPAAALVAELGLSKRIDVRSDVASADLVDLYRSASVFVQTSFEEGLGVSVLEAMACGLPVVATETAGSRETVAHGVTGWLVPQDPEGELPVSLARHILSCLADPDCGMGERGRERCVERFSTPAALRRFTNVYEDLLADPERAVRATSAGLMIPTNS